MHKMTFAIKLEEGIIKNLKDFCDKHGIKYSFFVEKAIKEQLEKEELKEDLYDLKNLQSQEKNAVSFEEYMRDFNV
ncbi:MAG: hypothetical protein ABIH00_04220 [Armatimonadota bacterium]